MSSPETSLVFSLLVASAAVQVVASLSRSYVQIHICPAPQFSLLPGLHLEATDMQALILHLC